jgi:hypothetical protein
VPFLQVDAALLNPGRAVAGLESNALLAVGRRSLHHLGTALFPQRLPVDREVVALKALPADLFGIQAVDHRVVDMFEEVSVDVLVDRPQHSVGIDQQHGDPRLGRRRAGLRGTGIWAGGGKDDHKGHG